MLLRATLFLLIVACGASTAWWINHFVGQRAANAPPPAGGRPLSAGSPNVTGALELTAARVAVLFGESSAATSLQTAVPTSLANVTLRGVYAPAGDGERGESGFAVFFLDGKEQRSVRPGETIRSGVTLVAVKANSAVLDVSGVRQTLALDAPLAGGSSSFRPALPPAPVITPTINIAPPGPPPALLPTGGLPNTPSSAIGAAAAAALAASNKASGK